MTVCPAARPESMDYWELLYNQHAVCEALVLENAEVAKALFHRQVDRLVHLHGPLGIEQAFILLTSLNRGLYNYLQYQLNLSLTACCYDNRVPVQGVHDMPDVFQAGDRIIMAYDAAIRANQGSRTHIEKACAYVQTHLDGDLSLSAVSEAVYLSKCHLCEIFRELVGCTFGDYVRQQRLTRARLLLRTTARTIEDIARSCGFQSATYFATVFKNELGMSPTQFRQASQQRQDGRKV